MTVRSRLALVVFLTGLLTAIGVIATVAVAFQRLEHERCYDRANAFLDRVLANHADILELHERHPETFVPWLRSLLLFEPDTQLYLLAADGQVLASSGRMPLAPGFKVALAPVMQAVDAAVQRRRAPYVMGDDPEHMKTDTVIGARALRRTEIRPDAARGGYLYVVVQPEPLAGLAGLSGGRFELFRSALAGPALTAVLGVVVLATLAALWLVVTITKPLRLLSDEVAAAARDGFDARAPLPTPALRDDEFSRLQHGFHRLMATLRQQWTKQLELDRFRREGVSNLSHDLRSPLTATAAALETLQQRMHDNTDRALVDVALRNTQQAAALVRSLGDLALLDEPSFRLDAMLMDVGEVLDDIVLRFAERAAQRSVALKHEPIGELRPMASIDVELFERAIANVLDNALRFTPAGGSIVVRSGIEDSASVVHVADSGCGIAADELPRLFDRFYQSRSGTARAGSEGGKGLGLAIVKRIAELHGGSLAVTSTLGVGTEVSLRLPRA